jgi:tetratricopeptide (TPR) repeat protein
VNQWQEIDNLIRMKDFKRAEIALAKLLRAELAHDDRIQALLFRAKLRLLSGRQTETLEDLTEIAKDARTAHSPEYFELLADTYFQLYEMAVVGFVDKNHLQQSKDLYFKVIQDFTKYQNMGWIYYQLGRVCLISGKIKEAETYFKDSFFKSSHVNALTSLAFERLAFLEFYENRDYVLASTLIDKAIAVYPHTESSNWLVQAYVLKTKILQWIDLPLALNNAKYTIQFAQQSPQNKSIVGEALLTIVEIATKIKGLERDVLDYTQQFFQIMKSPMGIDVTWARMREMQGDAYFVLQKYEQASEAYQSVLQYNPYHPWEYSIHLRIANCYSMLKNHSKTIDILENILKGIDVHEDYRIYELLAISYQAIGNSYKANQAYERAISLAPVGVQIVRV